MPQLYWRCPYLNCRRVNITIRRRDAERCEWCGRIVVGRELTEAEGREMEDR